MTERQPLSQTVESYRFWDVVVLWAKDRLEHENIVAAALARGVIRDGLRFQSIDTRWIKDKSFEFKGSPYVGFCATPDTPMCVLRRDALDHLLGIVQRAETPDRNRLYEEFILREDFRKWLIEHDLQLPHFWFGTLLSSGK